MLLSTPAAEQQRLEAQDLFPGFLFFSTMVSFRRNAVCVCFCLGAGCFLESLERRLHRKSEEDAAPGMVKQLFTGFQV